MSETKNWNGTHIRKIDLGHIVHGLHCEHPNCKNPLNPKRIKATIRIGFKTAEKLGRQTLMFAGTRDFEGTIIEEQKEHIVFIWDDRRAYKNPARIPKNEIDTIVYRRRWEGDKLVKDYF